MQILFKALLKFFVISILLLNLMLFTQGNSFAQNEKQDLKTCSQSLRKSR